MTPYLIIGDYIHQQRQELTAPQVTRIIQLYLAHMHNLSFPTALTSHCCKVIFILIDVLVAKENSQNAARILTNLLESCVNKLEANVTMQNEVAARVEKSKKGENAKDVIDSIFIETARPVGSAAYALEKPEDFFKGKFFFHKEGFFSSHRARRITPPPSYFTSWISIMPCKSPKAGCANSRGASYLASF
jgi:hypothetical protein